MSDILLKRGSNINFSSLVLKSGEPAFVTDLGKLYIGNGSQKILINPINKPVGINLVNFYSKVKANDYGQVISQSALTASDIPTISSSQVSGLGTASLVNVGITTGNVPVLNSSGKLSDSVLPTSSNILVYFNGSTGTTVGANQIIPLNSLSGSGTAFSFDNNGTITINETGVYTISYNITSSTLQINTALSYGPNSNWSGTGSRSSTTGVPSYVNASVTIIRQVTMPPEKFAIRNMGTTDIILINGYGSISMAKIK